MEAQQQHGAEGVSQCKSCGAAKDDGSISAAEGQDKLSHKCSNCQVFKSGPLCISSKGLGWTSWKKRWFILTRTSLIFFRSDPSASTQKGNEGNLTLGGIELNNSGSVVVRADKKLLTVLFPDGRDGRAFTLKAETSEDLQEWKTALENALAQAPSAALVLGQNSIFRSENVDAVESALEQGKDEEPQQSTIIGRPALLALEDVDGKPSFLEKALRFMEQHGIKTEGILRQSADVEEVNCRFAEYEQGKNEFSPDEDAHLIADCIKYVLREMPSSPVPASCCAALLEALRGDRGARVSRMYTVIYEIFPEPNRRLLKRILEMMRIVVSHKSENRMSVSAVAACMAPLLLRPLLAGDCELGDDFTMGGDGSLQLLQAAAAANHAQAIVIILLEEYDRIFSGNYLQEDSSSEVYSDSEDAYDEDEEDDDEYDYEDSTDNEAEDDDEYHDRHKGSDAESEDDPGQASSGASTESEVEADLYKKEKDCYNSETSPSKACEKAEVNKKSLDALHESPLQQDIGKDPSCEDKTKISEASVHSNDELLEQKNDSPTCEASDTHRPPEISVTSHVPVPTKHAPPHQTDTPTESASSTRRRTVWGRTSAKKNLSMESIEYVSEEEAAIQKLENTKLNLQRKLTEEVKENECLQASLEKRKQVLRERRMALQRDVERLQEQLQKERDFRAALEVGLVNMQHGLPISSSLDQKTRADLEEIALVKADISNLNKKVADLKDQLNDNHQSAHVLPCESSCQQHIVTKSKEHGECATASIQHNSGSPTSKDVLLEAPSRNETLQVPDMPSSSQMPQELGISTNDANIKSSEESSLTKANATSKLQNSMNDRSTRSREDLSSTKANATSKRLSKGEDVLSGETSRDENQAQLHGLKSQQSGESVQMQLHQSSNQNDTRSRGVGSSSLTESSPTEVKMVSPICPKDENASLGTTAGLDSMQFKSSSSLPNKPHKQNPTLSSQKSRTPAGKSGCSSMEEPHASGEISISNNSNKREKMLAGAASKNSKPQVQELAAFQPQSGQPPQKQLDKAVSQDSVKTLALNSSPNEKISLSRPDALSQKLNNVVSATNFNNLKNQQIPGSPPLRRRQPARKTLSRMGNPTTTVSLVPSTSSLPPEDAVDGAVSASKRSATQVEEPATSTSALNRLTNRLNFLKERRMQLASELQAMDLGRLKTSEGPAPSKSNPR